MNLTTFQIGFPRQRDEGVRIGAVRYLPRGVRKTDYAALDYFDVWLPVVAPSRALLAWLKATDHPAAWDAFLARYEREMRNNTDSRQTLQLLAALAEQTPIALGCYCADETQCHRTVLRRLIVEAADHLPRR